MRFDFLTGLFAVRSLSLRFFGLSSQLCSVGRLPRPRPQLLGMDGPFDEWVSASDGRAANASKLRWKLAAAATSYGPRFSFTGHNDA